MTQKELKKIRVNMDKPVTRQSKYGFKDMEVGETISIRMRNGDEKTSRLKSIRARCSQESIDGRQYVAWCDAVGVYYKREA